MYNKFWETSTSTVKYYKYRSLRHLFPRIENRYLDDPHDKARSVFGPRDSSTRSADLLKSEIELTRGSLSGACAIIRYLDRVCQRSSHRLFRFTSIGDRPPRWSGFRDWAEPSKLHSAGSTREMPNCSSRATLTWVNQ